MNTHNAKIVALSDKELDAVSGGTKPRVEVTKKQFDEINEVRWMFAHLAK